MSVTYNAGSAVKQGAGELDKWAQWRPGTSGCSWLLIAGAMAPPKTVGVSKRRSREGEGDGVGSFLRGIKYDVQNVEKSLEKGSFGTLYNTIRNLRMKTHNALSEIKELFEECQRENKKPVIYYTGHGEICTGDWCFSDGTISIKEIESLVCGEHPLIIADSCFSGHWSNYCHNKDPTLQFHCLSAAPEFSVSWDHPDGGGELTQWITGQGTRPSTEPLYSGGRYADYTPDQAHIKIEVSDFMAAFTSKTNLIVTSQTLTKTHYSAIFSELEHFVPRPPAACMTQATLADLLLGREPDKNIVSIAGNEKLYSMFSMEKYGSAQEVVPLAEKDDPYTRGYRITGCCPSENEFYVVMTDGAPGYESTAEQMVTICEDLDELETGIKKYMNQGMIITGLCYNSATDQYLLVMTKSPCRQVYAWGYNPTWHEEKTKEGYMLTLFYHDQLTDKILHVKTQGPGIGRTKWRRRYPIV